MVKWLRESPVARWLLLLARLWLGWQWISAALDKVGSPAWTGALAGVGIRGFLSHALTLASGAHPAVQGWYADIIRGVALPGADPLSYIIAFGELIIGIGLIVGGLTTIAALAGAILNTAYLLAGTVSTNPNMLIIEVLVLIAGFNAAAIGVDRWLIPALRNRRAQRTMQPLPDSTQRM